MANAKKSPGPQLRILSGGIKLIDTGDFAIGDKDMQDHEKTREQLIAELGAIREKMSELEQRQSRYADSETYLQDDPQTMSRFLDVAQDPDVEIATDDIAKFIDFPQLQSLMDDFYKLTKIGIAIIDLKGKILVATGWQDASA